MKPITPKEAREAAKLSVEQTADLVGCCASSWYNYEARGKWPTYGLFRRPALAVLRCAERNGEIYPIKESKGKR